MDSTSNIDFEYKKVLRAITNISNRLIEFYVILLAGKKLNKDTTEIMRRLKSDVLKIFLRHDIPNEHLKNFDTIDETLDILQFNFSYARPLFNNAFSSNDRNMMNFEGKVAVVFNALRGGRFIADIGKEGNIKFIGSEEEGRHSINHVMHKLTLDNPCLHRLRIADIANAPEIHSIIPTIQSAFKAARSLNFSGGNKGDSDSINRKVLKETLKLLDFFPWLLTPGVKYIYPQLEDVGIDKNNFGIAIHHSVSPSDAMHAFNDFPYQYQKYQSYHFNKETMLDDDLRIEHLKTLMSMQSNQTKYNIDQVSIEYALYALLVWSEITFNNALQDEQINLVFNERSRSAEFTTEKQDHKKTLTKHITKFDKYINETIEYLERQRTHQMNTLHYSKL